MSQRAHGERIALPKGWKAEVKSAVLHVIAMARYAAAYSRSWAADSSNARMRLTAENQRLQQEVALLREELRVKDARLSRIPPRRRPYYTPSERMAILELKASRSWSLSQTASRLLVMPETIASWLGRLNERDENALLRVSEPVNRFPDFVRLMVQRLKVLCPEMGKKKMAETLCRAGLHLSVTTIGRMLKERPAPTGANTQDCAPGSAEESADQPVASQPEPKRVVKAKRANHVWHVDLTTMSILGGFWTSWLPFSLPQRWPFCWWIAVALDHYSRRCMGLAVFRSQPTSEQVRAFLGQAMHGAETPKYLICDKGTQFWCRGFKRWCKRRGIKPRYGAVGQHGSIALIERFILTMKTHCKRAALVALRREKMRDELTCLRVWYNDSRPHSALDGRTPDETYHRKHPACRYPRFEPRSNWPRESGCARPVVPIRGKPGDRFTLHVDYQNGRRHLPIISLRRAA